MIYRLFTGNFIVALIAPIILKARWAPNLYRAIFHKEYVYYDFQIDSLNEFLFTLYGHGYFMESMAVGIMFLLPFQLIKNHFISLGKPLSYIKKAGILSGMAFSIILLFGTFSNIWWAPWYKNFLYLLFALCFGLFFSTLLYFMIDRYQEKQLTERN